MSTHNECVIIERHKAFIEQIETNPEHAVTCAQDDIADEIFAMMEAKNVSRAELARRMGVSRMTVTKMLRGQNLTIRTMVRVGKALGYKLRSNLYEPMEDK